MSKEETFLACSASCKWHPFQETWRLGVVMGSSPFSPQSQRPHPGYAPVQALLSSSLPFSRSHTWLTQRASSLASLPSMLSLSKPFYVLRVIFPECATPLFRVLQWSFNTKVKLLNMVSKASPLQAPSAFSSLTSGHYPFFTWHASYRNYMQFLPSLCLPFRTAAASA